MPKEYLGRTILPENSAVGGPLALRVSWGIGGMVQCATVNEAHEDRSDSPDYGWFVSLSDAEIDRLIKVLRRAKKQRAL